VAGTHQSAADRRRLTPPGATKLLGAGGGPLDPSAALSLLTDQHQLGWHPIGIGEVHQAMAAVGGHEGELTAEHRRRGHLQRTLAERPRLEEHHLAPQAAVLLAVVAARFPHRFEGGPAPQAEDHQPVVIGRLEGQQRGRFILQRPRGAEVGEGAPPGPQVAQEVAPLVIHGCCPSGGGS
jgi:hypothetical protein